MQPTAEYPRHSNTERPEGINLSSNTHNNNMEQIKHQKPVKLIRTPLVDLQETILSLFITTLLVNCSSVLLNKAVLCNCSGVIQHRGSIFPLV